MRRLLLSMSFLTLVTGLEERLVQTPPLYLNTPPLDLIPYPNQNAPRQILNFSPNPQNVAPSADWTIQYFQRPEPAELVSFVRTYQFPPENEALSLTAQDPLAVLETPPAELLRGEPHVISDYPNHQAIHMPVIPALNSRNLDFSGGMYVYQPAAIANCIDSRCFCPMVYNPVCAFDSSPQGFRPPDRGFRIFSNSCSFMCALTCDPQIQFAYCGECNHGNEMTRGSAECLKEVFEPPSTPKPVYFEPVVLRRNSFLQPEFARK